MQHWMRQATWMVALVTLVGCGQARSLVSGATPLPSPAPQPPAADDVVTPPSVAPLDLPAGPTSGVPLSLTGAVSLPTGLTGLANARAGVVSGATVSVIDIATGKRLGHGVTYYDGSYEAEVPAVVGRRAALVEVMLVDATSGKELYPLVAPVMLAPELAQQTRDVSVTSTAWYDLLYQIAAREVDQPPPTDWTRLVPGATALELASLVSGSQPGAETGFALFADSAAKFGVQSTADTLKQAIEKLVGGLVSNAKEGPPPLS